MAENHTFARSCFPPSIPQLAAGARPPVNGRNFQTETLPSILCIFHAIGYFTLCHASRRLATELNETSVPPGPPKVVGWEDEARSLRSTTDNRIGQRGGVLPRRCGPDAFGLARGRRCLRQGNR